MTSRSRSGLPGFAGIALADILANGTAMLIILIVITIAAKHEQEEQKLADREEVSVLMSRDIASSVVMNDLPSSAPAVLHDYDRSPLDQILDPAVLPIIELRKDYVRDFYTKKRYSRDELLEEGNGLDRLLQEMGPVQRQRIRVDIYDINLFYIAMSIIKKYGPLPAHWHFLEDKKPPASGGRQVANSRQEATDTLSDASTTEEDYEANDQAWAAFPQGGEPSVFPSEENYPFDDLAFDSESRSTQSVDDMNEEQLSDNVFQEMAKMMAESMSGGKLGRLPNVARFRTADSKSERFSKQNTLNFGKEGNGDKSIDYAALLASLFDFMRKADREAQQGDYLILDRFDFEEDILAPATQKQLSDDEKEFFGEIVQQSMTLEADKPLYVEQYATPNKHNTLSLDINAPLSHAAIHTTEQDKPFSFLPGDAEIQLNISLYPAIYKGLNKTLNSSHMVWMPKDDSPDAQKDRWRIVTLATPQEGDFILAFVYGRLTDDGELVINSDENGVQINRLHTYTSHLPILARKERDLFAVLAILSILLLSAILLRFRRASRH